jgi:DHA2 family multidrug resistance protein
MAGLAKLAGLVRREALVMSLGDVFFALTVLFVSILIFLPLVKRPRLGGAPAGGGH